MASRNDENDEPLPPNHSNIVEHQLEPCVSSHSVRQESKVQQAHNQVCDAESLQHAENPDVLKRCSPDCVQEQTQDEQCD